MKKTLAILLALLAAVSMTACGEKTDKKKSLDEYKQVEIVKTEETFGTDTFKFESIDSETVVITGYSGATAPHAITIPEKLNDKTVAAIDEEAFANCSQINAVDFSKATGLKTIGAFAFRGCEMITEIVLPDSVDTIERGAFYGCSGVTKITFAANSALSEIAENTFMECVALTEVSIPGTVETVGKAAFFGCTELTAVTLGEGVKTVGENAFQNCEKLLTVNLPATVTEIGDYAFSGTLYSED